MKTNIIVILLLFVLLLFVGFMRQSLQEVHWDSPIYLYHGKRAADTSLVSSYIKHAGEISKQVAGEIPLPIGEGYSEAYWHFMRMGNISLLGAIFNVTGSTESGIVAATRLYFIVFAVGVMALVMMVMDIGHQSSVSDYQIWRKSAFASGFIYAFSSSYYYIAANIVAEVIAVPLLIFTAWLLVIAIRTLKPVFSVLSGFIVYAAYFVKVETVLFIFFFYLALVAIPYRKDRERLQIALLMMYSGSIAFICYSIHAMVFHPLSNISTLIAFRHQVKMALSSHDSHGVILFALGGLLWVGAILSLKLIKQRLTQFSLLWLLLSFLPFYNAFFGNSQTQMRMLYPLLPPVFLSATIGWYGLLGITKTWKQQFFIAMAMAFVAIFTFLMVLPGTYQYIRQLPGAWRLQYIKALISPPGYEAKSYPVGELHLIGNYLYDRHQKIILLVDGEVSQENLNIIRFFGSDYFPDSDLAILPDPTNMLSCSQTEFIIGEPVNYRSYSGNECCAYVSNNQEVLHLKLNKNGSKSSVSNGILIETDHFILARECQF